MKEFKYKINGNIYNVVIDEEFEDNVAKVMVNGIPYKVELAEEPKGVKLIKPKTAVAANATSPAPVPRTSSGAKVISKPAGAAAGEFAIKAPLPGVILSINVKVGDQVKASDTVAMLEAMKMENNINAGRDGKVKSINVSAGDSVLEGATIITLE